LTALLIAAAVVAVALRAQAGAPQPPANGANGPSPSVTADSSTVQNGDEVTINGGGFAPGEPVVVYYYDASGHQTLIAKVHARADGDFGPIRTKIEESPWPGLGAYTIEARGKIPGHDASWPITMVVGGPPPTSGFTGIAAVLPAQFGQSCSSVSADVNTAAGEVASSTCSVAGIQVTYTSFKSERDLAAGLNSLGSATRPGACAPQLDDPGIIDKTQAFDYPGGHSGSVFCNYGNKTGDTTIGWTDTQLPLTLGVVTVPSATSYEQAYVEWQGVLFAE
jgi:hypothetical protein